MHGGMQVIMRLHVQLRKVHHHCNQCQQTNDTWLQSSIVDTWTHEI